jgi:hypothetical protein
VSELLGYVPVLASFVLGIIYLGSGEGGPVIKAAGTAVFLAGAYLQFFSAWSLAGVLILVALALALEFWRRMQ